MDNLTDEEVEIFNAGVGAERQRCLAIAQYLREQGDGDYRDALHWIEGGSWPEENS